MKTAPSLATENDNKKMIMVAMAIIKDRVLNSDKKINVTTLAKNCGVSRAWIYKNFGSTNSKIVLNAIDILAPLLTAPVRPSETWNKKNIQDWINELINSFKLTMDQVDAYPELFQFYLANRVQKNEVGLHLAHHESRFVSHVVRGHIEKPSKNTNLEQLTVFAEHLLAIRVGLIFKWLADPDKDLQKKRKDLQTFIKPILATLDTKLV